MLNNANDIRFRCSSLGHLVTNDRSGKNIGKSVYTNLIDVFASAKYDRKEEITSKFLEKGNACEEDAITLLSRVNKKLYTKNTIRLTNDFITGETDLFIGKEIENADETLDTKTSWSLHTFLRAKYDSLNPIYEWQGVGAMWLTGAKKHTVAYCLVNGTDTAIIDEKRRLAWRYGADPDTNPEYIKKCQQIERNHIFDMELFKTHYPFFQFHSDLSEWIYDIPKEERVHCFSFERNEEQINFLRNRIIDCRVWMNKELFKVSI